ncbi:MAG: transcription-repair coupling factor [Tepidiformaceae bacterium]
MTAAIADVLLPSFRGEGGPLRLGVPETAKPAVAAAFAARGTGPTLLLTATPARSLGLSDEVALFLEDVPLARLPEREQLPYEMARRDDGAALERARALAILRGAERGLVVASWAAISERGAGPQLQAAGIDVAIGSGEGPTSLTAALERAGYEVAPVADRQAAAARRGGIVDVFPAGADSPFRIEFFGPEVESIRQVDLGSQRSTGRVERLHLPPAATGTREAHEAARALHDRLAADGEGAETVLEQLELVAEGNRSEYESFLEPLLYESTALDHLAPGTAVLFDDAEEGQLALERLLEHQGRARQEQEERGAIPRGLPPLNAPADVVAEVVAARAVVVHLQRFGTEELGARRLPLRATPTFAGKLKPLALQAAAWAREGSAVVVASQQALRLAELMEQEGIAVRLTRRADEAPRPGEIVLVPLALGGGFIVEGRLVVVSDAEVFGFRKRRRPTRGRAGLRSDLVSTLEAGDYLVHADHGIARYGGLVRRTVDGAEREYLELLYAEGDKLYVPADQLESVNRYVGPADHPPALTRLGSQEWARAKRRVKHAVAEMAHELLELYAQREAAEGHAFAPDSAWQMEMEAAFPFVETADQLEAIGEVKGDMERPRPMDRLICGDVGYGKTEVAVRAAFKAVTDGRQVAVLVPTTVLAEQHGNTFRERTAGFPVRVEVLSRFRSDQQQRAIVADIASGAVDIAIGTHRLLQRDVQFKELGLVVIDEEQRFGVAHKERLKRMRAEVDVLTLSATPIPRTLQMSLAGIRDMSTVMTPPEERQPIRTYVLQWDDEILREAIEREVQRNGQVYFVHNRVHNIERIVHRLREVVPDCSIAIGHGQMPEDQLERVMTEFAAGEHDVLVCTTIIESGLDIPNANTIVINNADQLGLAQLYQLRGRVGRSAHRAYAYLLYDKDRAMSEPAQKRLEAVFEANELGAGFQIALRDLEIRGAGNVLGAEQSGHIAAVGFDMYSKLVAEAVSAIKAAVRPGEGPARPPLSPVPPVDLPLSAHIPESYIDDIHARLALYQRMAGIESPEGVAEMQEELRDRFGSVPIAVEQLLYVALVKSMAQRARVQSIKTAEHMFHIRVASGVTPAQRAAVEALREPGLLLGPNQVRIDRVTVAEHWQQVVVRVLRAMAVAAPE